ncbi:MAG: penicillin-binding protein 2 [Clostridia bacterium]|nr:penicillin-binding protein 2 [Clostridia bacterium]
MQKSFYRVFSRRSLICFFVIVCLFTVTGARVYEIATSENYLAAQSLQSTYRENIALIRGTVYDCNMISITNNKKTCYAAIPPTPDAVVSAGDYLSGDEKALATEKFKERKVAVCRPEKTIENDNVATTYVYSTDYEGFLFEHLVGYIGSDGHGESGIEAAYDDILYSGEYASAVYAVSGTGYALLGEKPAFQNDVDRVKSGVMLTVDINAQRIVSEAAKGLRRGAVIIADAKTGKIRALLSKPSFSPNDLSSAVKDPDSPFINRALTPFAVGSVFKPCIAAAAIDNNIGGVLYNCTGRSLIDGRYFSCHKREGHGVVDLRSALAFSCNGYFYNLGMLSGAQTIRKSALLFSFGSPLTICKNVTAGGGNITALKNLNSNSAIANFSIGQGDILISPVGMLTLYQAIAGDGSYYIPSVVEAILSGDKKETYDFGNKTKAMSAKAAAQIREALREVVISGTAKQANSEKVAICGKTATAQTGRYDGNGTEITNSWFCGFFPYEDPEYVGVVMSDGASDRSPALIFKEIAENLCDSSGNETP